MTILHYTQISRFKLLRKELDTLKLLQFLHLVPMKPVFEIDLMSFERRPDAERAIATLPKFRELVCPTGLESDSCSLGEHLYGMYCIFYATGFLIQANFDILE